MPPFAVLSAQLHALAWLMDPADAAFDGDLPDHVLAQAGLAGGQRRFARPSEALAVLLAGPLLARLPVLPDPAGALAAAALAALAEAGIGPFDLIAPGSAPNSAPDPGAPKRAAVAFVTAVAAQHEVPSAGSCSRWTEPVGAARRDGALPTATGRARQAARVRQGTSGRARQAAADEDGRRRRGAPSPLPGLRPSRHGRSCARRRALLFWTPIRTTTPGTRGDFDERDDVLTAAIRAKLARPGFDGAAA